MTNTLAEVAAQADPGDTTLPPRTKITHFNTQDKNHNQTLLNKTMENNAMSLTGDLVLKNKIKLPFPPNQLHSGRKMVKEKVSTHVSTPSQNNQIMNRNILSIFLI